MKKEKMTFAERQKKITFCRSGKMVLVLLNEKEKEETLGVMDDQSGEMVTMFEYDAFWMDVNGKTYNDVIASAKREKTAEIDAYDTSPAVNVFVLNGERVWLDKATRVGLMNSTNIAKTMGETTTTLWLGGAQMTVNCDKAIQLLSALEMYALQCYNVTAQHKAAVEGLSSIEEVLEYDFKVGYPEQLKMEV